LPKTSPRAEIEAQLIAAHAKLKLTRRGEEISIVVTLMRLGAFEVRLIEPTNTEPADTIRVWMELFDHDRQFSIDSIGNCALEDAVIVAEDFIERATRMGENPHSWRRST
jgi:hypothetical protein